MCDFDVISIDVSKIFQGTSYSRLVLLGTAVRINFGLFSINCISSERNDCLEERVLWWLLWSFWDFEDIFADLSQKNGQA